LLQSHECNFVIGETCITEAETSREIFSGGWNFCLCWQPAQEPDTTNKCLYSANTLQNTVTKYIAGEILCCARVLHRSPYYI